VRRHQIKLQVARRQERVRAARSRIAELPNAFSGTLPGVPRISLETTRTLPSFEFEAGFQLTRTHELGSADSPLSLSSLELELGPTPKLCAFLLQRSMAEIFTQIRGAWPDKGLGYGHYGTSEYLYRSHEGPYPCRIIRTVLQHYWHGSRFDIRI